MVKKELRKLTLAATLTALSIVIDILSKTIIPSGVSFGFPFYAIPLVIGSIVLGPIYGVTMGFLSDLVGFISFPQGTYDILFALQAMAWGVIPWLIARRKSSAPRVVIAVLVTHIVASLCSTTADFFGAFAYNGGNINQSFIYMWRFLPLRLMMMPVNIILISVITYISNQRLEPIYEEFFGKKQLNNQS